MSTRRCPRTASSPTASPPNLSAKRAPHTGISRLPCADTMARPSIWAAISASGNCPPCRCAMRARSGGGVRSAGATGPLPRPSTPWHALQYCTNYCCPTLIGPPGMACSAHPFPARNASDIAHHRAIHTMPRLFIISLQSCSPQKYPTILPCCCAQEPSTSWRSSARCARMSAGKWRPEEPV